jgi:hypothetical protein
MSVFEKASVDLIKAYHCGDITDFHDYVTGNKIVIDAFIPDPHGSYWLAVTRPSPNAQISKVDRISKIKEFQKYYEIEMLYEDRINRDVGHETESKYESNREIQKEVCLYCGYVGDYISGDDVYFGYIGWPICPNCKGR